jgi:hypothetical protein
MWVWACRHFGISLLRSPELNIANSCVTAVVSCTAERAGSSDDVDRLGLRVVRYSDIENLLARVKSRDEGSSRFKYTLRILTLEIFTSEFG